MGDDLHRHDSEVIGLLVNRGSGPVYGSTLKHAERNIAQLVEDIAPRVSGVTIRRLPDLDAFGRFAFDLVLDEHRCRVDMPGRPLEEVRDADGVLPRIPPRLYVNGDSWFWYFAVGWVMRGLGVELPEEWRGGLP